MKTMKWTGKNLQEVKAFLDFSIKFNEGILFIRLPRRAKKCKWLRIEAGSVINSKGIVQ